MGSLKISAGEAMPIISRPWTRTVWCCDQKETLVLEAERGAQSPARHLNGSVNRKK